jgi:hypothetical protein
MSQSREYTRAEMTSPDSNSNHNISLPKPKGRKIHVFSLFFRKPDEYLKRRWAQNNNNRVIYPSPLVGGGWIIEDSVES